jgi:hypothetical protein
MSKIISQNILSRINDLEKNWKKNESLKSNIMFFLKQEKERATPENMIDLLNAVRKAVEKRKKFLQIDIYKNIEYKFIKEIDDLISKIDGLIREIQSEIKSKIKNKIKNPAQLAKFRQHTDFLKQFASKGKPLVRAPVVSLEAAEQQAALLERKYNIPEEMAANVEQEFNEFDDKDVFDGGRRKRKTRKRKRKTRKNFLKKVRKKKTRRKSRKNFLKKVRKKHHRTKRHRTKHRRTKRRR